MQIWYQNGSGLRVDWSGKVTHDGRRLELQLPTGRFIPLVLPSFAIADDHPAITAARHMAALAHELDAVIEAVGRDHLLSLEGRAARTAQPRRDACRRAGVVISEYVRRRTVAEQALEALLAPPKLDMSATLEIAIDRECRDHWRGLPTSERLALLDQMIKGEHTRLALALLRSPVPLAAPTGQVVAEATKVAIRALRPAEIAAAERALEPYRWADDVLPGLIQLLLAVANLDRQIVLAAALSGGPLPPAALVALGFAPNADINALREMTAAPPPRSAGLVPTT